MESTSEWLTLQCIGIGKLYHFDNEVRKSADVRPQMELNQRCFHKKSLTECKPNTNTDKKIEKELY